MINIDMRTNRNEDVETKTTDAFSSCTLIGFDFPLDSNKI